MLGGLADLVHPLSAETFLSDVYGKEYGFFAGRAGRFEHLLSWPELNEMVATRWSDTDTLRLASKNRRVDRSEYVTGGDGDDRLDVAAFADLIRTGASLVLEDIASFHAPISRHVLRLEDDLHERLGTQLFVSGRSTSGFGVHWDPYDVFALQIRGERTWQIYRPTRPFPLLVDKEAPRSDGLVRAGEVVLTEGDVLYLPRGWWHDVLPGDRASMHLTVAVAKRTGVDYLAWLGADLRGHELLRRDVPRFGTAEELHEYVSRVRDVLAAEVGVDSVHRYLRQRDGHAVPVAKIDLPRVLDGSVHPSDDTTVMRLVPRVRVEAGESADEVVFVALGEVLHFDAVAEKLLVMIASGFEFRTADLIGASGLARPDVIAVLMELESRGVLAFSDDRKARV